jgi:glycosyltransferase involved in cell wall biosynthesis
MMKETHSIIELSLADRVEMVGILGKNLLKEESIDERRRIVRLKVLTAGAKGKVGKLFFYVEAYCRYFFYLLVKEISVINCHSLMMLPVAVPISKLKKCKLIYDTHELESERTGLVGFEKTVSKFIEKRLIKYCDSVITVGPAIGRWYKENYKLGRVFTVRNIPSINLANGKSNILRDKLGVRSNQLLFIYQGYFLKGRGLEVLLEAFCELPQTFQIVFMGEGPLQAEIETAVDRYENIHFQKIVPYSQILEYTSSCDIGISLFENTCLSHYYVLPNKLFEYLKSHLPILVSDFPEMRDVVQTYNCGWTVEPTKDSLTNCILNITREKAIIAKKNAVQAASMLQWKNEELQIRSAFEFQQFEV